MDARSNFNFTIQYLRLKTINYHIGINSSGRRSTQCTWWTSNFSITSWINFWNGVRVRINTPKRAKTLTRSWFQWTYSLSSSPRTATTWSKCIILRVLCGRCWTSVAYSSEPKKRTRDSLTTRTTTISVASSTKSVEIHFCRRTLWTSWVMTCRISSSGNPSRPRARSKKTLNSSMSKRPGEKTIKPLTFLVFEFCHW